MTKPPPKPLVRLPRAAAGGDPADVEAIRCSLVELRRLFQRRELAELWAAAFGQRAALDYGDVRLLDAVHVAPRQDGGATVGTVARLLGIDPSRASRLVAAAVRKGLVSREAAPGDARKVVLVVTKAGAALQAKGSELTRSRIELALATWSPQDGARLAQLLARFVAQLDPAAPARPAR